MTEAKTKELSKFIAENELKKSSCEKATEIFKTRSRMFCIGLVIHLIMYLTGGYEGI
jgi:hypothetical protein